MIAYILCSLSSIKAQVDAFATIKLNRTEVYPEQPIKATITVSTATWFTAPLSFDNLQVPNAFVIPFKRTLSTSITRNGKNYPSIQFFYLIYPYKSGDFEVPELIIQAETPPVGDYKGEKTTLQTRAVAFQVKKPPSEFKGTWFIANSVSLVDQWNKPIQQVKVGDVLERNIKIYAAGTLPKFIPPVELEAIDFVSIYEKAPSLEDKRNTQTANGERIEKAIYLFEKEGTYEIPEVRIDWWNPYQQKAFFKRIPSIKVEVKPNPDLGMIASVRDSLNLTQNASLNAEVKDNTIWGMKPWQLGLIIFGLTLLLFWLVRFVKRQLRDIQERRKKYLRSEEHYFQELLHFKGSDKAHYQRVVYRWWDSLRKQHQLEASIARQIEMLEMPTLNSKWLFVTSENNSFEPLKNQDWKQLRSACIRFVSDEKQNFSTLQRAIN